MQPGDTITPDSQPTDTELKVDQRPVENPVRPSIQQPQQNIDQVSAAQPQEPSVQSVPEPVAAVAASAPAPYEVPRETPSTSAGAIQWTASEYVDHAKSPAWFAVMGLGLLIIVVGVYLILKDVVAAALLGLAGITFGVFAGRRPQVLQYAIDDYGIHIGSRVHRFEDFKSFSLTEAGPLPAILLTPLKRFLPPITVFYDPKEEDSIVGALADYLPHEDKEPDLVDRLMSRIRF